MNKKRVAKEIAVWLLTIFLVFLFARAGIAKFDDASGWSKMFRAIGFPVWFRILIGILEVGAAVLILIPRVAIYGTMLIGVVMLGAIGTQLVQHHLHPAPFSALAIATIVFLLRWPARRPALPQ
ncbi:MAG TPA: DoxX family protein [Thermoanaerobaculia bacterium]|nr:DoxX family protein [Thermoanaerobaculia bacterium]